MSSLILKIIAGILGIFLATELIPGVSLKVIPGQSGFLGIKFTERWQPLILIGIILGLFNFFIKPILNLISLPLKLLTFGLFSLVIDMVLVKIVEVFSPELEINGILPLFLTTLIVWILTLILRK
jgi:putative membrane protein